jgi:hypothetical protein
VNLKNLAAFILGILFWIALPAFFLKGHFLGSELYWVVLISIFFGISLLILLTSDQYLMPWEGEDRPISTFLSPILVIVFFFALTFSYLLPAGFVQYFRSLRQEKPVYDATILKRIKDHEDSV